jgi:hypothetical protein
LQGDKPDRVQQPQHLGFTISAVPPGQPDQTAAPVRSADHQKQHPAGPQTLHHLSQGDFGHGQMFQKMGRCDKVEAIRGQIEAVQIARDQVGPPDPQPLLCRSQHRR